MREFLRSVFNIGSGMSAWAIPTVRVTDILDILVIAVLIYELLNWVRKTRAWVLLRGILILLLIMALSSILRLNMTKWVFQRTISVGILAVIIIFQPELRRALEQLGRGNFVKYMLNQNAQDTKLSRENMNAIIDAIYKMAEARTGALIALEQEVSLREYEQTGIALDAAISSQLIINIFEHNTPLHDGAVIIRDNRIAAATCYLPLSSNDSISKDLGTRHRAGLGLSEAADCKVLVVSEETGAVSLAVDGVLHHDVDRKFLLQNLVGPDEKKRKGLRGIIGKREKNS